MRRSPSMVPAETGHDTYLVREDLGRFGQVWRETAEADANHETLIRDLIDRGWLLYESRTFVTFTPEGAELFA